MEKSLSAREFVHFGILHDFLHSKSTILKLGPRLAEREGQGDGGEG